MPLRLLEVGNLLRVISVGTVVEDVASSSDPLRQ